MTPVRLGITILATVVLLAVLAWGAWSFDPFSRRKHAESVAVTAEIQSAVDTKTATVTADQAAKTVIILREAQGAANVVEQAQGAGQPLSPAVADAVRAGVERLRQPTKAGDDQPAADVSPAL